MRYRYGFRAFATTGAIFLLWFRAAAFGQTVSVTSGNQYFSGTCQYISVDALAGQYCSLTLGDVSNATGFGGGGVSITVGNGELICDGTVTQGSMSSESVSIGSDGTLLMEPGSEIHQDQAGDIDLDGVTILNGGTFTGPAGAAVEVNLGSTSTLEMQLGTFGFAAGELDFGGTLDLSFGPGVEPTLDEYFPLFEPGYYSTGQFSTINVPALPDGYTWDFSRLYTIGGIEVVPEPASGFGIACGLLFLRPRRARPAQSWFTAKLKRH